MTTQHDQDGFYDGYESEEEAFDDNEAWEEFMAGMPPRANPFFKILRMDEKTTRVLEDFLQRRLPGYGGSGDIDIRVRRTETDPETLLETEEIFYLVDHDAEPNLEEV